MHPLYYVTSIKFDEIDVQLYEDHAVKLGHPLICFQARKPEAFYTGLCFMDNETGEMRDAEGNPLTFASPKEREVCIKSIVFNPNEFKRYNDETADKVVEILKNSLQKKTGRTVEYTKPVSK